MLIRKIVLSSFGVLLLGLISAAPIEARSHFSLGFGFSCPPAPRAVIAPAPCYPCYVGECYPVFVPGPYCAPMPGYMVAPYARVPVRSGPCFSVGFGR